VVRAEPQLGARMLTKKGWGARFFCGEVTVNGWLRLSHEPGWLLADLRGIGGQWEVAKPVAKDAGVELDVPGYQPQGLCCLEVCDPEGVDVWDAPGGGSSASARPPEPQRRRRLRRPGELLFARARDFGGWLRLQGEDGWVCASPAVASGSPVGPLKDEDVRRKSGDSSSSPLRLRRARHRDWWSLSDVWAAARRSRIGGALTAEEVAKLKQFERCALNASDSLLESCALLGGVNGLVADGLITEEDLLEPEVRCRQHLFASILRRMAKKDPWLGPHFEPSQRPPPLPSEAGDEEEKGCSSSSEGEQDREHVQPEEEVESREDRQQRHMATPTERCCALCGAAVFRPQVCSQCRQVRYCGRDCQRGHWALHRKECRKASLAEVVVGQ